MKEETIEYKDGALNIVLTVRQATVLDGMTRSVRVAQMYAKPLEGEDVSDVERMQRLMLIQAYPACLTVTSVVNRGEDAISMDMTPEEFLALPDILVIQWEEVVFRLNPHWVVKRRSQAEEDLGEVSEPNEEEL